MPDRTEFSSYNFGLVICRNPKTGKFLAVNETKNRGWWIPGGGIDSGETFRQGARRECIEEAGVEVDLKGILKVEYWMGKHNQGKMRVIFYAEPKNYDVIPKQVADSESIEARWVSLDEFPSLGKIRGDELLEFGAQVERGEIYPLNMFMENE